MKNYTVRMRCVVTKEVYCVADSEEQVRANPWDYAENEQELEQIDWDVVSVKVES